MSFCRSTVTGILAQLAAMGLAAAVWAQDGPGRFCAAAPPEFTRRGDLWPDLDLPSAPAESTSVARMVARVAGTYDFVAILTEGAGVGKHAVQGWFRVARRAPDQPIWAGAPERGVFAVEVFVTREGSLHDSLRAPKPERRELYWSGFYEPPDVLWFHETDRTHPSILDDPRPVYRVATIDSAGAWRGRWGSGGVAFPIQDTPVGQLWEAESGYFCAWRASRR